MVKNKTKQWMPHFFKPILSGSDQQLVIPISFRCNLESSDGEATLRSDNLGKTWRVKVEKMEFQDGWKEFAQEHDLKAGNFLVFRYEGGMAFRVMVFESTMCLREYTKACIREYTQVDGINGGGMDNLKKRKKDGGKEIEISEKRNEDSGNSTEIIEKSHTTNAAGSNSERTSVLPSVKGHLHVNIKGYNLCKRGRRTVDAITDGEGMENPGKHKKDSRMEREICEHRNEESGNSTEISEKSDEERGNTTETSSSSDYTSNLPSVKKGQCCVKIKPYNLRKRGRLTVDAITDGERMENPGKHKKDSRMEREICEHRNEESGNSTEISEKSDEERGNMTETRSSSDHTSNLPSVKKGQCCVKIKPYNLRKRGRRTVDAITDGGGMENLGKHKKDSRMEREICEHRNEENGNNTEISEKSDEERGNTIETSSSSDHTSNLPSVKKGQCCVKIKPYNLRKRGLRTVDAITDGEGMENPGKHKKDSRMEREICEHRNEESGNSTEISEKSDEERGNMTETSSSSDHTSNLPSVKKGQCCVKIKPYNLRKRGRRTVDAITDGGGMENLGKHKKDSRMEREICEHRNEENGNNTEIREKSDEERGNTIETSSSSDHTSNLPSVKKRQFCVKLKSYNLRKPGRVMIIPPDFARANSLTESRVILKGKKGRSWQVEIRHRKNNGQVYIGPGWAEFCDANRLNLGDICTFEIVLGGKKVLMEVTIFHSDGSVTDDDEAPSFCKTITRKTKFLTLPSKFVRKNGLMKKLGLITLVDKTGSRWRVKLRYDQFDNRVSIGGGWKEFSVSNRLNTGDVCSFKLLSGGKNVVMEVTVSQHTK